MTAPDPSLGEIEAKRAAIEGAQWDVYPVPNENFVAVFVTDDWKERTAEFIAAAPAGVAYLLAELRKAQDALGRVEGLHFAEGDADHSYADICFECRDTYPCPTIAEIRAAVAAATGGERG